MDVKMADFLAARLAVVYAYRKTVGLKGFGKQFGGFFDRQEQGFKLLLGHIENGLAMGLGNDHGVPRGSGMNIEKCDVFAVLVYNFCPYFFASYPAKKAVRPHLNNTNSRDIGQYLQDQGARAKVYPLQYIEPEATLVSPILAMSRRVAA